MRTKESAISLTDTSPAAASTVVSTAIVFKGSNLFRADYLVVDAILIGGTGGTLTTVRDVRASRDGVKFADTDPVVPIAELRAALRKLVAIPTPDRLFYVADAMRAPASMTDAELFDLTAIDPWFLSQMRRIVSASSSDTLTWRIFLQASASGRSGMVSVTTSSSSEEPEMRSMAGPDESIEVTRPPCCKVPAWRMPCNAATVNPPV